MTDGKEVDQRFKKNVNVLGFSSQWEDPSGVLGKTDIGLFVIPYSFRGVIGGMVIGR